MDPVATQTEIVNSDIDASEFPQHAHVYWSGRSIQVRAADGRLLAEASVCPCGDFRVLAFNRGEEVYREKSFERAEAEMLLNLFVAAEMATLA
jgi:hypothetical protein